MEFFSVFGEFFSKLHADAYGGNKEETPNATNFEERCAEEGKQNDEGCNEEIPEITDGEMQSAIKKLKKKVKLATTMESALQTSKTVTNQREK